MMIISFANFLVQARKGLNVEFGWSTFFERISGENGSDLRNIITINKLVSISKIIIRHSIFIYKIKNASIKVRLCNFCSNVYFHE